MYQPINFGQEIWVLNAVVMENTVLDADEFAGLIHLEQNPREKIIMKQMLVSSLLANLYLSNVMSDVILGDMD